MKLRNGKNTNITSQIIKVQSFFRMKIGRNKYYDYLKALHFLNKQHPHLFHFNFSQKKIKKKRKTIKKFSNTNIKEIKATEDDIFIAKQYQNIKDLGTNIINGVLRSTRKNKQKKPDRYMDENYLEIMLEDSKIEEILESGSDVDSDYKSEEDVNSDESDGEWNLDFSESEESVYSDLE
jgi:hypothetical protein